MKEEERLILLLVKQDFPEMDSSELENISPHQHRGYLSQVTRFLKITQLFGYYHNDSEFCCYHVTTEDRLESILSGGLIPNSEPSWFTSKTPYVMLSLYPYWSLYEKPVLIEVKDPAIKRKYFDDPEGLRWPSTISPEYFNAVIKYNVVEHGKG